MYDPACGSGGMFVQSAEFIAAHRADAAAAIQSGTSASGKAEDRIYVYGREKTLETVKLAKMNLAVNGLRGTVIQANTCPVIASTSIKAHHKEFKVQPPVITTGRSGSLGDVLYVNAKAWPLNTALYVKDFCGNSPFLIFYTLQNMRLENFNAGAGVPSLNRNYLNGISIAVPFSAVQTAFDEKLSPIFDLKERLEKQVELLKHTRDSLLPRLISGKLSVDALDIRFPPGMVDLGA